MKNTLVKLLQEYLPTDFGEHECKERMFEFIKLPFLLFI